MRKVDISGYLVEHPNLSEWLATSLFLALMLPLLPFVVRGLWLVCWGILAVGFIVFSALYKWNHKKAMERQKWPINPRYLVAGMTATVMFSIMTGLVAWS